MGLEMVKEQIRKSERLIILFFIVFAFITPCVSFAEMRATVDVGVSETITSSKNIVSAGSIVPDDAGSLLGASQTISSFNSFLGECSILGGCQELLASISPAMAEDIFPSQSIVSAGSIVLVNMASLGGVYDLSGNSSISSGFTNFMNPSQMVATCNEAFLPVAGFSFGNSETISGGSSISITSGFSLASSVTHSAIGVLSPVTIGTLGNSNIISGATSISSTFNNQMNSNNTMACVDAFSPTYTVTAGGYTPSSCGGSSTYFGLNETSGGDVTDANEIDWNSAGLVWTSPASPAGSQTVCELTTYAYSIGGTAGHVRLGLYTTGGTLLCQGIGEITVDNLSPAWVGHIGRAALKEAGGADGSACVIQSSTDYTIAMTCDSSDTRIRATNVGTGNDSYHATDYTSDMPATLPSATTYINMTNLRCGIQ